MSQKPFWHDLGSLPFVNVNNTILVQPRINRRSELKKSAYKKYTAYTKAILTLSFCPETINNEHRASALCNIGPSISARIKNHLQTLGRYVEEEKEVAKSIITPHIPGINKKLTANFKAYKATFEGGDHLPGDGNDEEKEKEKEKGKGPTHRDASPGSAPNLTPSSRKSKATHYYNASRAKKVKKKKPYIPQKRSGGYAILVAMFLQHIHENLISVTKEQVLVFLFPPSLSLPSNCFTLRARGSVEGEGRVPYKPR